MADFVYADGYVPFCIRTLNESGKPFEKWDGSTYLSGQIPSDGSGNTVYGEGSLYCVKVTPEQLVDLYWNTRTIQVDADFSGSATGSASIKGASASSQISAAPAQSKMYPDKWTWGRTVAANSPSELNKLICAQSYSFSAQNGLDGDPIYDIEKFPNSTANGETIRFGSYSKTNNDSDRDTDLNYDYDNAEVGCSYGIKHFLKSSWSDLIKVKSSSGKYEYWAKPTWGVEFSVSSNVGTSYYGPGIGWLMQQGVYIEAPNWGDPSLLVDSETTVSEFGWVIPGKKYERSMISYSIVLKSGKTITTRVPCLKTTTTLDLGPAPSAQGISQSTSASANGSLQSITVTINDVVNYE